MRVAKTFTSGGQGSAREALRSLRGRRIMTAAGAVVFVTLVLFGTGYVPGPLSRSAHLDVTSPGKRGTSRRALLQEVNHTAGPRPNMTTRSCWETAYNAAENAYEHFVTGGCVYGKWCGEECTQPSSEEPSVDDLDEACKQHDMCLSNTLSTCRKCACDAVLRDTARQIFDSQKQCNGLLGCLNPFCFEEDKVSESFSISGAIDIKMRVWYDVDCASIDYSNGCPDESADPGSSYLADSMAPSQSTSSTEMSSDTSSCPYQWSYDANLHGGDLQQVSVSGADECCSVCNGDQSCYAWTYLPNHEVCGGPCCFLKDSSWTAMVADSAIVSGVYNG